MDENIPPIDEDKLKVRKNFNKEAPNPKEPLKIPSGNQQFIANRHKVKKVKSESFTKKLNKNLINKEDE